MFIVSRITYLPVEIVKSTFAQEKEEGLLLHKRKKKNAYCAFETVKYVIIQENKEKPSIVRRTNPEEANNVLCQRIKGSMQ